MLILFKAGCILTGCQYFYLSSAVKNKNKKCFESDSNNIVPQCHYHYSCGLDYSFKFKFFKKYIFFTFIAIIWTYPNYPNATNATSNPNCTQVNPHKILILHWRPIKTSDEGRIIWTNEDSARLACVLVFLSRLQHCSNGHTTEAYSPCLTDCTCKANGKAFDNVSTQLPANSSQSLKDE